MSYNSANSDSVLNYEMATMIQGITIIFLCEISFFSRRSKFGPVSCNSWLEYLIILTMGLAEWIIKKNTALSKLEFLVHFNILLFIYCVS